MKNEPIDQNQRANPTAAKWEIEPSAYVIALSATTKRMELSRLGALMPGATADNCYSKYGYQGPYNNNLDMI
ncbi:hypothetical protein ACN42_g10364 [Penicillium freii]|uniref:Uncharacterized protein n=1 Tax=Penicillium freii TaxID=48697 RepID=A0A101MA67_PENFR|nr:hypothetical protein ACN42_g10364 [Penicillium freii]